MTEIYGTHCMTPEPAHNCLHRMLVLFQQHAQLTVFMQQRMVLDYNLRVLAFEFGLKYLCKACARVRNNQGTCHWSI